MENRVTPWRAPTACYGGSPLAIRSRSRVERVYFKVQEAWTARNQDIAEDCMSDALYCRHKLQTDQMLKEGTRNVLESINLSDVTIVEVNDFSDNSKDQFWAYIEGSMVDYTVRESTGEVISGYKDVSKSFHELWKFIRTKHGWVLDRIDEHVLTDLLRFHSATDHAHQGAPGDRPRTAGSAGVWH
jgi:hypothetical protein